MKGTSFPHDFWCKMVQVVWFSWQYGFSSTLSFRDIPGAAHQLRPWHRNGQCPPEGWAAMQVAWNHKWIIHWIPYIEFLIPPDSSIKLGLKIVWGRLIMIIMRQYETCSIFLSCATGCNLSWPAASNICWSLGFKVAKGGQRTSQCGTHSRAKPKGWTRYWNRLRKNYEVWSRLAPGW